MVDGWKSGGNAGNGGAVVKKEKDEKAEAEGDGKKKGEYVTLRFEGEDEVDMVNSVERRYVLPDKAG